MSVPVLRPLSPFSAMLFATAVSVAAPAPPPLKADTLAGWNAYAAATEGRINREVRSGRGFLAMDFAAPAATDRRAVLTGGTVVAPMQATKPDGAVIDVPSAMMHHWRGAVLIPGATLDKVLARLQSGVPGAGQEDVLRSAILDRGANRMNVFLKIQRRRFVTVVYNTEHAVTFTRYSAPRASSTSVATKIAELDQPGTAQERELAPGMDRGFLWRWNSYWRYEEVAEGVIAECESISLSRGVPYGFGFIVAPLIDSTARESMDRALMSVRAHFSQ